MKKLLVSVIAIALLLCAGSAAAERAVIHKEVTVIDGVPYVSATLNGMTIPLPDRRVQARYVHEYGVAFTTVHCDDSITYMAEFLISGGADSKTRNGTFLINNTSNFMITENVTEEMIGEYEYIRSAYMPMPGAEPPADDEGLIDYQEEYIEIDGHPARLVTFVVERKQYENRTGIGALVYNREGVRAEILLATWDYRKESWDEMEPVTMDELKALAALISFDRAAMPKNSDVAADGEFTLAPEGGTAYLAAGEKARLDAVYADPKKTKDRNRYFHDFSGGTPVYRWTVTDAQTGEPVTDVDIQDDGTLTVPEGIAQPRRIEIRADNNAYITSASCLVTLVPKASGFSADPAEVVLYEGNAEPRKVNVRIDPDCIPADALTWKPAKKDIVEITANGDGTLSFRPVKKGETAVTLTAPGGQSIKLKAAVYVPVTDLSLKVSGKPKPGATVTVKEAFTPKAGINKQVEWSVDVGTEIAEISGGKVKISKTAPAGTVITVTCRALGAPEAVERTVSFEVAE